MPKLTIDGREVTVADGTTVLQAAQQLGLEVPTFCYHPGLSIAGNCRMCLVEVEKSPKPVASCATPATEGMVVHLGSPKATEARKGVIEFLLGNHPLDCPICDRAGECVLQDNSMEQGDLHSRFAPPKNHKPKVQDIGPHVVLDAERCIMCSRCVRFTDEVSKSHELGIFGRGNREEIGVAPGLRLDNPYSGCVVDLCPVGALTAKEFRFQSRAWFLKSTESVCPSCARGCNITVDVNESAINKVGQRRVYRFMPRHRPEINQYWMCDEGRYRYRWLDEQRVLWPTRRTAAGAGAVTWEEALSTLKALLAGTDPRRVGALLSCGSSVEDLFLAREFWRGPLRGAAFAADAPSDRPPTEDDYLVCADKWPNSAGARLLGLDGDGSGWVDVLDRALAGELDVLVIVGHDLARIRPAADVDAALHRVRHVVALAGNESGTTAKAELLLPLAAFVEREGTFVNVDGRVQRFRKALEPVGAAAAEWKIWKDLLGRFGEPRLVQSEAEAFAAAAAATPALHGLDYDRLGSAGAVARVPAGAAR